ncbi:MAG: gliding motility protein GldM, partial [Muribaculaceae bacterium]|nr:gliding motility protein GldM [Muribaculaceae bacterium]
MINLMYIVLTAMLALNVSSDVLDGFTQVEDGLSRSNNNVDSRNSTILTRLQEFAEQNPEKGRVWSDKAAEVRHRTFEVYNFIDSLKLMIVREADGEDGDPRNILNRDDLESSSVVMLPNGRNQGERLRLRVDAYREYIMSLIPDEIRRANVAEALNTNPVKRDGTVNPQTWEEAKFETQPV